MSVYVCEGHLQYYICTKFIICNLHIECGLCHAYRKALRTAYILGFGNGFTDGMFFFLYAVVFRFGTFLITLDEDHVLHREFDDVYT